MPYTKLSGHQQDGLQASGDCVDVPVQVSLASSTTSSQGQCYGYDQTNLVIPDGISNAQIILQNSSIFLQKAARGVLMTSANAAGLIGAQTNATFTSAASVTSINAIVCRCWGHGLVLAGAAAAGTAVTIGGQLAFSAVTSASQSFVLQQTTAATIQGAFVGYAMAGYVQTSVAASVASGSHAVTPANPAYITTATSITIDVPSSGVQETLLPTAVTAAAGGNTVTFLFGNAHTGPFLLAGAGSAAAGNILIVPSSGNSVQPITAFINC